MPATRVTLVTEIPAPYRIPLFNALAERVQLRVLFLAAQNPDRPYRLHDDEIGFRWEVVPGVDAKVGGRWLVVNRGLWRRLAGSDALLLGGWNQPAYWSAFAWARALRRPVHVWVESTPRDRRPEAGGALKQLFARGATGFVVPGRESERYVRSIAPAAPIAIAPNAVDNAFFASRVGDRDQLRGELGLEGCVFLYVGRLSPEKGVASLIRSFAQVEGAQLIVAGTGPQEQELRAAAPPGVRFLGYVDRDEMPAWYAAADALVLPSVSEPWGMPLNEAAAAGLPLVATESVGAAWELVDDGANGFRVPPGDDEALRASLGRLAADPDFRRRAGERSRELVAPLTPDRWAEAVAEAIA